MITTQTATETRLEELFAEVDNAEQLLSQARDNFSRARAELDEATTKVRFLNRKLLQALLMVVRNG